MVVSECYTLMNDLKLLKFIGPKQNLAPPLLCRMNVNVFLEGHCNILVQRKINV